MSAEHGDPWSELKEVPGIGELPFPWPVGGAMRLGLHASLRRFYRITPDSEATPDRGPATEAGGLRDPRPQPTSRVSAGGKAPPATVVLVLYESDDADAVARYERTARWFLAAGARVPRIYGATTRALIVEDGGDLLLAEHAEDQELTARYVEAARVILALQARGLEVQGPNPDWRLDAERFENELAFTEEHALRGWLESNPSPRRAAAFERLATAAAELPRRMCHRDYHSRNLLVGEELMVVDFQDAMEGPLFYDLVSLLWDDYRDVPTTARAAAIETFWAGARTSVGISGAADVPQTPGLLPAGARQGLALTAAQRSLKALGTFGYQVSVAGRHEYAAYARRTWGHAKRALASLGWDDLLAELDAFGRL